MIRGDFELELFSPLTKRFRQLKVVNYLFFIDVLIKGELFTALLFNACK